MPPSISRPWYERAFAADYLERYAHRSDELARIELPFLLDALKLPARPLLLDLCCGAGRHSRALAARLKRGRVVALDLSPDLLHHALRQKRAKLSAPIAYLRGDKRQIPLATGAFDGVVNLFTSFGYFTSDREHLRVLREIARVLTPGGRFVMDFMNSTHTREHLVARNERIYKGVMVIEQRRYDARSRRIIKTVSSGDETLTESIRAYTPAELSRLLHQAGLNVLSRHGNLCGDSFNEKRSLRCVLVCQRES